MSETTLPEVEDLRDFVGLKRYLADLPDGGAFDAPSKAEWFIRRHRKPLIESGQYIPRRGSTGALVGPRFGSLVLEIMRAEAQAELRKQEGAQA